MHGCSGRGFECITGIYKEQAVALLKRFYDGENQHGAYARSQTHPPTFLTHCGYGAAPDAKRKVKSKPDTPTTPTCASTSTTSDTACQ